MVGGFPRSSNESTNHAPATKQGQPDVTQVRSEAYYGMPVGGRIASNASATVTTPFRCVFQLMSQPESVDLYADEQLHVARRLLKTPRTGASTARHISSSHARQMRGHCDHDGTSRGEKTACGSPRSLDGFVAVDWLHEQRTMPTMSCPSSRIPRLRQRMQVSIIATMPIASETKVKRTSRAWRVQVEA